MPAPDETLRYGSGPDQVASVWWPRHRDQRTATAVLFLHGGFWRAAWDRAHVSPLAVALAEAGFAVCTDLAPARSLPSRAVVGLAAVSGLAHRP